MKGRELHPRAREGFTLIELLMAAATAFLVVAAAFTVYRTVAGALSTVHRAGRSVGAAVGALDTFSSDAARAVGLSVITGETCFALQPAGRARDGAFSSAAFYSVFLPGCEAGSGTVQVQRVSYAVEMRNGEGGEGAVLVRGRRTLSDEGVPLPETKEEMMRGVLKFVVTAFDGKEWRDGWPVEGGGILPLAVRVTVSFRDGSAHRTMESEVVIRSGLIL